MSFYSGFTEFMSLIHSSASAGYPSETVAMLAHGPVQRRTEALSNVKRLLEEGERSLDWDLSANIARAREDGHPDVEWLEKLEAVTADEADVKTLDEWAAWKDA